VGDPAYEFVGTDLAGDEIALSSFRGQVVMLNFWASWCPPCGAEIPHMVQLYEEYRAQGFEILAVNLRERAEPVGRYAEQQGMTFPIVMDINGKLGDAFYVRAIPRSIFLDREGVIRIDHTGSLSEEQLREYVETLLADEV
jgi:thiol-disulfide isomerase/thioredoxin